VVDDLEVGRVERRWLVLCPEGVVGWVKWNKIGWVVVEGGLVRDELLVRLYGESW